MRSIVQIQEKTGIIICSSEAYDRFHPTGNGDTSSGGGRPLPCKSTTEALTSIVHTLNFIDSWLQ